MFEVGKKYVHKNDRGRVYTIMYVGVSFVVGRYIPTGPDVSPKEETISNHDFNLYREKNVEMKPKENKMIFEVGKKYKSRSKVDGQVIYEIIAVGVRTAFVRYELSGRLIETIIANETSNNFEEVKEPKTFVCYFNMYHNRIGTARETRAIADENQYYDGRIGCKRVVFTEGEFDE